ncbi:MAG: HAD family hydrolase [Propionivibrio sp.]
MGKFDGYLLVSDFDGTLINDERRISRENVQAIESFVAQGGRFLGATGRTEINVRPFAAGIQLSSPWILYNGAAIFDWAKNAFIYRAPLDRALSEAFARKAITRFPDVNVQIYPGGAFYWQVNPNAAPDSIAVHEKQDYHDGTMEEITDDWLKLLFCSDDPAVVNGVEAMLADDRLLLHAHKTRSGPRYFELTALGVNKGSALARLRNLLKPRPRRVVAIGDYLNDVEMLIEADIAAAPESAIQEVRDQAQIITADHNHSAIADLIDQLEKRCAVTAE